MSGSSLSHAGISVKSAYKVLVPDINQASLDERLRFAIAHRRLVELSYHGTRRVAEPHDYGVQDGTAKLFIYQLRETSRPPRKVEKGWRLLILSTIDACQVLEATFAGSRGESYPQHQAWDCIYARVT